MKSPLFVTRSIGSAKFFLGKNGPTLMTVGGVAGFVATTALTVRATLKAQEKLPDIQKNIQLAKDEAEGLEDRVKVRIMSEAYKSATIELGKVYWPVLISGSASIVLVLAGHNLMLKRQASLVAAYSALDAGYKAYRKRVADRIGAEEEQELYSSLPPCSRTEDDEEGNRCEIFDAEDVLPHPSPYARFFDESSVNWRKTPEYNLFFLKSQEQWANDRLTSQGFLFLNEVYEALGLERCQAGQAVGWRKHDGNGDHYVDFGIYQIGDESSRAFVNGVEATILLDFNVDGVIRI